MEDFVKTAIDKITTELKDVSGQKQNVVKHLVSDALISFCRKQPEFAQAVVQSDGTLKQCMDAVVKDCGNSLSDIEAYRRAVQFYFPGAVVDMQLTVSMSEFDEKPTVEASAAEVRSEIKEEAEAEIRALQSQNSKLQMAADPTIQQFTVYFEQMQNCYNKMQDLLEKCANLQTSAKLSTALLGLIDSMGRSLRE